MLFETTAILGFCLSTFAFAFAMLELRSTRRELDSIKKTLLDEYERGYANGYDEAHAESFASRDPTKMEG